MLKNNRRLKSKLTKYQRYSAPISALLGNNANQVAVSGRTGYVYARLMNRDVIEVFNSRVPLVKDLPVFVGYDPNEPQLLQVLSVRVGVATNNLGSVVGKVPSHHETHEWFSDTGGTDVVFSHIRQFLPLRPTPIGGMELHIFSGIGFVDGVWKFYSGTIVDLESAIPATGARFALVYLDSDGIARSTTGTTKSLSTLNLTDIPIPIPGTIPIAAVRLRSGQTSIVESKTYTDLADLRIPMAYSFLNLSDTPSSYTGHAGKAVFVKGDESGLEFVNIPSIDTLFLHSEAADVGGYSQLLTSPADDPETTIARTISSASGSVPFGSWITYPTTGLGTTILNGGNLHFVTFATVSSIVGVTTISAIFYKRASGGAETFLFSGISAEINNTSVSQIEFDYTTDDIILDATDRLVVKYYCQTSSAGVGITVTLYYEGNSHYTHIHTPFSTSAPTSNIGGSGTPNAIPIFTSSTQLGDSDLTNYPTGITIADGVDLSTDGDGWQNYFPSSTVNGWSSFTTQLIYYKKIGRTVFVQFNISGTSNSTSTNFTLPYPASSVVATCIIRCSDSGTASLGNGQVGSSSSTLNLRPDATQNNASWTNSGTKTINGNLVYETAT